MQIIKNFLYNFVYNILIIIVPFITMPYISRVLGPKGVGSYSYTYAIATYFTLFAMLGLEKFGNREIARVRNDKNKLSEVFWNIYFMQFITSILSVLAFIIFLKYNNVSFYYNYFLIQLIYVSSSIFNINWLFYGLEEFKFTVFRNTVVKIISVICVFTFVKKTEDLGIYVGIMAMSFFISNLVLWPKLFKTVHWNKPSVKQCFLYLKPNLLLFIPVISISLYKILSKIMIGEFSDLNQLGYYENAEKINYIQITLATTLGTVMLPRMSNFLTEGNDIKFKKVIRISMKFVMFISIGSCFGLVAVSNQFIPLFLGNNFYKSVYVLYVLAPTGIFIAWANVIRTQFLIPKGWYNGYTVSIVVGALLNVILNLLLIPKFGAIGSAIGIFIAELSVMIIQTVIVKDFLDIKNYVKDSIFFIPISVVMFLVVRIIQRLNIDIVLSLLIQIFIGGFIYILLTFLYLRYVEKNNELAHVIEKLKRG